MENGGKFRMVDVDGDAFGNEVLILEDGTAVRSAKESTYQEFEYFVLNEMAFIEGSDGFKFCPDYEWPNLFPWEKVEPYVDYDGRWFAF